VLQGIQVEAAAVMLRLLRLWIGAGAADIRIAIRPLSRDQLAAPTEGL
jgi:hypothetical protein